MEEILARDALFGAIARRGRRSEHAANALKRRPAETIRRSGTGNIEIYDFGVREGFPRLMSEGTEDVTLVQNFDSVVLERNAKSDSVMIRVDSVSVPQTMHLVDPLEHYPRMSVREMTAIASYLDSVYPFRWASDNGVDSSAIVDHAERSSGAMAYYDKGPEWRNAQFRFDSGVEAMQEVFVDGTKDIDSIECGTLHATSTSIYVTGDRARRLVDYLSECGDDTVCHDELVSYARSGMLPEYDGVAARTDPMDGLNAMSRMIAEALETGDVDRVREVSTRLSQMDIESVGEVRVGHVAGYAGCAIEHARCVICDNVLDQIGTYQYLGGHEYDVARAEHFVLPEASDDGRGVQSAVRVPIPEDLLSSSGTDLSDDMSF